MANKASMGIPKGKGPFKGPKQGIVGGAITPGQVGGSGKKMGKKMGNIKKKRGQTSSVFGF